MFLLLLSPMMRGGNRHVALIVLECLALAVLLALWATFVFKWRSPKGVVTRQPLLVPLLMSPLLLALLQLMPLPASWWVSMPGHAVYAETLEAAGIAAGAWRPLSVSPDATAASLLAAIPLVAIFILGYFATTKQLRALLMVAVVVAFGEIALGLLQVSGGQYSPLFFGVMSFGPPVGTFANRNHYANYLAMALAAYIWLAYEGLHIAKRATELRPWQGSFTNRHATALWVAGGLVLVLGILLSRSRGAALFGLPMAALGLAAVALRMLGWKRGWRFAAAIGLALLVGSAALIGFDNVASRLTAGQLSASASFRAELALTSLHGAMEFWPFGSGWGTYDLAYQRFQPPSLPVYPNHAHQDYVQLLFEGGIFFVMLAAGFLWLAAQRALLLARKARRDRTLDREAMAATLCGLGLLGLLLHSLVEFNMRIPANAILGALLAGAYLRPLSLEPRTHDRPAQPHPPRHRRRRSKPRGIAGDGADSRS